MNWKSGWLLGLLGVIPLGINQSPYTPEDPSHAVLAQPPAVPWAPSEQLNYHLTWQGLEVGRLFLFAEGIEGGWRFRMKLEPTGLAQALGYGLEAESQVGYDLYTDRFWQTLREPLKGTTRLIFERQENSGSKARVIHPDGRQTLWQSPHEEVLDMLSLVYLVRVRPEIRTVYVVDFPKLAQGRLETLPPTGGLVGYRFAREDLLVEGWYRLDTQRTPVRLIFGRDFGRLQASLMADSSR